jgi:hypothetical protein
MLLKVRRDRREGRVSWGEIDRHVQRGMRVMRAARRRWRDRVRCRPHRVALHLDGYTSMPRLTSFVVRENEAVRRLLGFLNVGGGVRVAVSDFLPDLGQLVARGAPSAAFLRGRPRLDVTSPAPARRFKVVQMMRVRLRLRAVQVCQIGSASSASGVSMVKWNE